MGFSLSCNHWIFRRVLIIRYWHSFAINSLQAGDSYKVVQEQMGHYSSAFTMDVYAAVSETMRKDSQARMEGLIKAVSKL